VYIRAHAGQTLELPWCDDAILRDLDTPEDYRRLSGMETRDGIKNK
jgi:hypothetical protein